MAYLIYFPEEAIALQEEIAYHPKLIQALMEAPATEQSFIDKLAIICTYCGILVDGHYDVDDVVKLCKKCIEILQKQRTIVVN